VHIRAAHPGEHRLLSEIAYQAKAHWGYASADLSAWHAALTVARDSVREHPTLVAEVDGAVVGFLQLCVQGPDAQLEHLWVLPAFTRRGIGAALLDHAVRVARAARVRELHIDADPHAEAFYTAHGAVRVGQRSAPIEGQPRRVRPQLRLPVVDF
jgi:ribosomal protein S18 acetylase RimI-like enzyme